MTDIITQDGPSLLGAMALPSFHTLAIYAQVLTPLFSVRPVGIYPPVREKESDLPFSPTPDNILDHTRRAKCDGLIVIPTLLHIWSHSPKSMDFLRSLRIVVSKYFLLVLEMTYVLYADLLRGRPAAQVGQRPFSGRCCHSSNLWCYGVRGARPLGPIRRLAYERRVAVDSIL